MSHTRLYAPKAIIEFKEHPLLAGYKVTVHAEDNDTLAQICQMVKQSANEEKTTIPSFQKKFAATVSEHGMVHGTYNDANTLIKVLTEITLEETNLQAAARERAPAGKKSPTPVHRLM
jgi:hypothetical protein